MLNLTFDQFAEFRETSVQNTFGAGPRRISGIIKSILQVSKMSSKSYFETPEEAGGKLARKAKESPFMMIGLAGFIGAGLWGAYKYKTRGTMSTSVFLMQLRVAAQGTVVGTLTLGLAYAMAKEYLFDKKKEE